MIDPLTAVTILGASLIYSPTRLRVLSEEESHLRPPSLVDVTVAPCVLEHAPATVVPRYAVSRSLPPLEQAKEILERFRNLSNVPDQAVSDAVAFLDLLPGFFPIPTPMVGEDGSLGLFWDTDEFYADIEFHGDRSFALFTRERGYQNVDIELAPVSMADAAGPWIYKYLGALVPALQRAA